MPPSRIALTVLCPVVLLLSSMLLGAAPAAAVTEPLRSAEARAAADAYVEEQIAAVGAAWDAGEVFADPGAAAFWDDRQQAIVAEQVQRAERTGAAVNIALVAARPDYDRDGEHLGTQRDPLLQRILMGDAQARSVDSAVYVVWDERSVYSLVVEDGVLVRDLGEHFHQDLNAEVPGPAIHYALRTLDPAESTELTDVEREPRFQLASPRTPMEVVRQGHQAFDFFSLLLGLGVIAVLTFLHTGARPLLNRIRGQEREAPRSHRVGGNGSRRARSANEPSRDRQLDRLHEKAVLGHRWLQRTTKLSADTKDAVSRLPEPEATSNPVVLAAWSALADEARGAASRRCFFRPDLCAEATRTWDALGTDLEVPVSEGVRAALDDGRDPSYLSAKGIDRGRPYWREKKSPFAASGFGAFGPLSAAIAAMPESWSPPPGPGAPRGNRGAASSRRDSTPRAGRSRPLWADVLVVGVLIPVVAIALATAVSWHNHTAQVAIASPANLGPGAVVGSVDTTRTDSIVSALREDQVYIDPGMRMHFSPADEERLEQAAADAGPEVAVVALDFVGTDEFRGDKGLFLREVYAHLPGDAVVLLVGAVGVDLETHEVIPDFEAMSAVRDRIWDLPVHAEAAEYLQAWPQFEWVANTGSLNDFETTAQRLADRYEPRSMPGSPEYFTEVRNGQIAVGVVILLAALVVLTLLRIRRSITKENR
ncbi:hypothetical protein GCM10022261_22660 [Brevibacterium daeguense]|uniref:Cyclic nucleotide-binding domain-containing protein n=1 Tax=Brevibacterium daeguense TaxID=909936 RepID=A0ABP8EL76_9MICO|nr:hypothetical protein [Brevibacterium daeguense]